LQLDLQVPRSLEEPYVFPPDRVVAVALCDLSKKPQPNFERAASQRVQAVHSHPIVGRHERLAIRPPDSRLLGPRQAICPVYSCNEWPASA
jgi:hypothetical protein